MYNPGKTMFDNFMGTRTKDIVFTQVVNGQTVVSKKTVPWDYDVTGKDFLPTNPTSETVGAAVDTAQNVYDLLGSAINFLKENYPNLILGGIALIIILKRI